MQGGEEENLDMEKHLGNKVLSLSELEAWTWMLIGCEGSGRVCIARGFAINAASLSAQDDPVAMQFPGKTW